MKMKLAKYMAEFFVENGITDCFMLTGGGAMHLNDAFGHQEGMICTYNHHEQACAIASEGYARLTGRIALCCVTTGPGGTNTMTGVMGGWVDSIPMFIVSGQVKRETTIWSTDVPLRQLGDQEFNIVDAAKTMTKYAHMVTEPSEIRYHLEKALFLALNGRPGPVWLDIPLDVQAAVVETDELIGFDVSEVEKKENPIYDSGATEQILEKIRQAKRPVILAGSGIRLGNAYDEFLTCLDKLQIPVLTAWNSHDLVWNEHPLFCGKPGTMGTRGGNFIVQNCDLLLVLGCRMNIRIISYNRKQFAQNAYKIVVDIDENELRKPTVYVDLPIHANVKDVMKALNEASYVAENENHRKWLSWCRAIDARYPATRPEFYKKAIPVNPYAFMTEFFSALEEGERVVCGNGTACVVTFQACNIKRHQRVFANSGCASMGYGVPAAIGAAVAEKGRRVLCLDGDGSFQMNMQELQTMVYNHLNIKLFYLNNNGYHSIRQTQTNLFEPPLVGVCDGNGLSFPDAEKLAYAYGIPYIKIDDVTKVYDKVKQILKTEGPVFCEVVLDPAQNFEPKLSSKVLPDGRIISPSLDDMSPFLSREEYDGIRKSIEAL